VSSQAISGPEAPGIPSGIPGKGSRTAALWRYAAATYVLLLVNHLEFLSASDPSGVIAGIFAAAVYFTGALLHLLLVFVPVLLLHAAVGTGRLGTWTVYGTAVALFSLLQGLTLLDAYVYRLYGFHFNGMVWNLVITSGGLTSMGAGISTVLVFCALALGVVAVQAGLLAAVLKVPRLRQLGRGLMTRRRIALAAASVALLVTAEKVAYAVSVFRAYAPVPAASTAFPFYIPVTFSTALRRAGFSERRDGMMSVGVGGTRTAYPLAAIRTDPVVKPPNVIWLVSESLRADMLDPAIMPAACRFGEESVRFLRHYSGGNGTRMGMFSMFYGLPGTCWQSMLAQRRSPVLLDRLQDAGYSLHLYTSAEFSFPELDKTVFARVPASQLHEAKAPERWKRDRDNVDAILAALDRRDPSKPFFTFMFFESPHAPYTFPPECALSQPCVTDLNYLTMDLKTDIGAIKNSYINAVRHLDTQLNRVFAHLREKKLLDSTIVVLTGDHGEEFMEKGRWGHHSAYSEEQIRVPLILRLPGVAPAVVDRMTSHLDLPSTLLPRLGVTNPASDYGLGVDLLKDAPRTYLMVSGWSEVVYVDDSYKAVFPVKSYNLARREIRTRDDGPADISVFLSARRDQVTQFMKDLRRFP